MSTRIPLVAGNWKMNKTSAEAAEFCGVLRGLVDGTAGVDIAICPPYTAIGSSSRVLAGSTIRILAQAVHEAPAGAHTGEISAAMVAANGATGTLVGHSERRAAGETDAQVAARVRAALDAGLFVIMCCGESLEQRDGGETLAWIEGQVTAGLAQVAPDEVDRFAVAYEPIWAIGTGRTATPEQAQEACAHVRAVAGRRFDGAKLRVLYGGSVTPDNAGELMVQPDVDGSLVGGASLKADSFAAIVRASLT